MIFRAIGFCFPQDTDDQARQGWRFAAQDGGLLVLIPQLYIIFCFWRDAGRAFATRDGTAEAQQRGVLD